MKKINHLITKNKKGVFAEPLVDIFAFIAIIFLFLIFSFLFNLIHTTGTYDIKGTGIYLDSETELNQLLRAPVEIDGHRASMAEHIIYSAGDNEKTEDLKTEIEKLFLEAIEHSDIDCLFMIIEEYVQDAPGHLKALRIIKSSQKAQSCAYGGDEAKAYLPGNNRVFEIKLIVRMKYQD